MIRRSAGLAAIVLAFVLGAGPAVPASAADSTGAITVIFMNPAKQKIQVSDVPVSLVGADGHTQQTVTTGPRGRVTFSGVPAGAVWRVHAEPPQGTGATDLLPADRAGVSVGGNSHIWTVLVLRQGASLGGTITTPWGERPGYMQVAVRGQKTGFFRSRMADENGHFWINGLPTDDYSIQYNPRGGSSADYYTGNFIWSFWHTSPDPLAIEYVHVVNEDGAHVASRIDGLDGMVDQGQTLTGAIHTGGIDVHSAPLFVSSDEVGGSYQNRVESVAENGAYHFMERLRAGRYRFKIVAWSSTRAAYVDLWYAGENQKPAYTESGAQTVAFDGTAPVTITFGKPW